LLRSQEHAFCSAVIDSFVLQRPARAGIEEFARRQLSTIVI
jgi:hypothetical protein